MRTMNRLRDIALAIWYGDCGFKYSNKRIGIHCGRKPGRIPIFCRFFNEVSMPCRIRGDDLIFDVEGTRSFLRVVGHRLPEFMLRRL